MAVETKDRATQDAIDGAKTAEQALNEAVATAKRLKAMSRVAKRNVKEAKKIAKQAAKAARLAREASEVARTAYEKALARANKARAKVARQSRPIVTPKPRQRTP